jgi:lysophospholipase L1-like esterase
LFNLFEEMPFHSMGEEDKNEYWGDGLHFKAAGYEKIGGLVAKRMIQILGDGQPVKKD